MAFCTKCGNNIEDDKFCTKCGTKNQKLSDLELEIDNSESVIEKSSTEILKKQTEKEDQVTPEKQKEELPGKEVNPVATKSHIEEPKKINHSPTKRKNSRALILLTLTLVISFGGIFFYYQGKEIRETTDSVSKLKNSGPPKSLPSLRSLYGKNMRVGNAYAFIRSDGKLVFYYKRNNNITSMYCRSEGRWNVEDGWLVFSGLNKENCDWSSFNGKYYVDSNRYVGPIVTEQPTKTNIDKNQTIQNTTKTKIKSAFINAENGLNLRSSPSTKSAIIMKLDNNDKVEVIEITDVELTLKDYDSNGNFLGNITDNWVKIKYQENNKTFEGYVFNGYLGSGKIKSSKKSQNNLNNNSNKKVTLKGNFKSNVKAFTKEQKFIIEAVEIGNTIQYVEIGMNTIKITTTTGKILRYQKGANESSYSFVSDFKADNNFSNIDSKNQNPKKETNSTPKKNKVKFNLQNAIESGMSINDLFDAVRASSDYYIEVGDNDGKGKEIFFFANKKSSKIVYKIEYRAKNRSNAKIFKPDPNGYKRIR
ncbi:SH3 domain-containing protein [Flavobacteriaceae bacterium]|nr:SH3 domain-containing protein [Flavobacteriaceae bacterium]